MTSIERKAIAYLPVRLAEAVTKTASLWNNTTINEIRLRENRLLSLTVGQKNIGCGLTCTRDELSQTVAKICGNSLYSHSESIREGCITTDCGIRVGVCGHAVVSDGLISLVRDISSINIRIPQRAVGAADKLYELTNNGQSVLIYSRPSMGKTTTLRELIPLLSSGDSLKRVSVIDTRYELCAMEEVASDMTDVFYGYPRYEGVMNAIRTMSPEYIICDEISSENDAKALLYAHSSGISVCASIHAGSYEELSNITIITPLFHAHVFDVTYGIMPDGIHVCHLESGEKYVY